MPPTKGFLLENESPLLCASLSSARGAGSVAGSRGAVRSSQSAVMRGNIHAGDDVGGTGNASHAPSSEKNAPTSNSEWSSSAPSV
eukprot:2161938-Rhodomonas_salina.2